MTAKAGTEPAGFFTLGYISKTKGLKGAVHLKIEAGQPAEYEQTESVFLEIRGTPVPFFVLSFRLQPDLKTAVLLLEDVDTVEKARELAGKRVLLPVSVRKNPEPEPFEEFLGYRVIDRTAGELGQVTRIEQYPGHTVAVLGEGTGAIMIPLHEGLIERIDKQKQELFVNLPEGLVEIYR